MVYMQPQEMGWRPLYNSWLNTLPAFFESGEEEVNAHRTNILELVDIVVDPIIDFVRKNCQETSSTNDQALI